MTQASRQKVEQLDSKRLVKLLNLTRSPEDGESLSAIRKANSELERLGLGWHQVIGLFETAPGLNPPASIKDALELLNEVSDLLNDWQLDFIESITVQCESSIESPNDNRKS